MLFFGCRNEASDYYYRAEWEEMQREGVLAQPGGLVTAFSRDQPAKVYVTHRIRKHGKMLWDMLQQQGWLGSLSGLLVVLELQRLYSKRRKKWKLELQCSRVARRGSWHGCRCSGLCGGVC